MYCEDYLYAISDKLIVNVIAMDRERAIVKISCNHVIYPLYSPPDQKPMTYRAPSS